MSRAEQLQALLERAKAAAVGGRDLDHAVLLALGFRADIECMRWRDPAGELWPHADNPSGSLDAALALVERVLPPHRTFVEGSPPSSGWKIAFYRGMTPTGEKRASWDAMIRPHAGKEDWHTAPTAPLALLAALLSALIAQEERP